ncbi:hypothetical protein KOR42_45520 [Thalassoglobus neptunius]|uniref:Flagellar motor switch protein FliM n=1 Tax=Thalassoglobus neptunius TaxID=1938619 RepID=A0A5C5VZU4_9PLAN|nr:hypothetical protein [Thalassoglobus neptunius]TWT43022.1 hypothetical protein KOR42_45520 [Thalassoglobus neptunius]
MSNNVSIDPPIIEPADFDKPRRPKQVLLKMLNQWLAETTARVTESWMSVCTHPIQLGAQSIEIIGDETARKSLPEDGYAIALSLGSEQSTGFLCIAKRQIWMLLADLLNLNPDELPHDRSPTQTERSMLEILIEMYVSGLAAAWPGGGDLPCQFDELIERPHRKRIRGHIAHGSKALKLSQVVLACQRSSGCSRNLRLRTGSTIPLMVVPPPEEEHPEI